MADLFSVSPSELEAFIHGQIPLAQALGARVVRADETAAAISTPLAPNRNHMGTAFGGSLSAALILAGYTWLYHAMAARGHSVHVILGRSEVDYLQPVAHDFIAVANAPAPELLAKFLKIFERRGVARLTLHAEIHTPSGDSEKVACRFTGEFIAERSEAPRLS
jgi:thioesterase domain-containing protein